MFDNARVAVKEGFGRHAKATDKYLAMSAHYSFKPVFCNIASGHEKGLVEGLVGLVRRQMFVPVPHVDSLDDLEKQLLQYCLEYRNHKIPSKPDTVAVMAQETMKYLNPLPPYQFDTSKTVQIKADEFSLIRFDYNKYSVPYEYSNKSVTVKGCGNSISIKADNEEIASYPRDYRRGQTHFCLEHYIELIARKPRSVYNAAPVKQCIPQELNRFLMKLDTPENIVKTLRLYIEHGNELLNYLSSSSSYEDLNIRVNNELKMFTPVQTDLEISVNKRNLNSYDTFLMKGVM